MGETGDTATRTAEWTKLMPFAGAALVLGYNGNAFLAPRLAQRGKAVSVPRGPGQVQPAAFPAAQASAATTSFAQPWTAAGAAAVALACVASAGAKRDAQVPHGARRQPKASVRVVVRNKTALCGGTAAPSQTRSIAGPVCFKATQDGKEVHVEACAQEKVAPAEMDVGLATVLAAGFAAMVMSDPAQAADLAADVAAQAAADVADAVPTQNSGDWFDPFVQANAGIIAGLDDVVEDKLHLPNTFGFAIIFYTTFIKLITYPLNSQALRSNAMMQLVNPKIQQIQKRYQNDQETQSRMLLRLYDDIGVNPLSGCLPSIIQLPIFIGLYRSINKLAETNEHFKEPFLWIPSLSGPVKVGEPSLDWLVKSQYADHFEPLIGWQQAGQYLILPVALVISQFLTQKASNPQGGQGPSGALLGLFPLIIGYSTLVSPAGLGVYWFMNNVLTQAQTAFIRYQLGEEFPEYKQILEGKPMVAPKAAPKEATEEAASSTPRGFAVDDEEDDDEEDDEPEAVAAAAPAPARARGRGMAQSAPTPVDPANNNARRMKRLRAKRRR